MPPFALCCIYLSVRYLTLCCIAKNEHRHLREWLEHHVLAGVERFIIYDNDSDPPLRETLGDYLHPDFLTVVEISGPRQQLPAYAHCLQNFGEQTHWLGFIDADELLVPKQTDDLKILLTDYEEHAGLGVNWVTFGSNGHIHPPEGLQMEHFTRRTPNEEFTNCHIKSIVRPDRTIRPLKAHMCAHTPGYFCVDENHMPLYKAFSVHSVNKVQLNHYYYRSQQEYFAKVERGRSDTGEKQPKHLFYAQLDKATVEDTAIMRFIPRIRALRRKNSPALLAAMAAEGRLTPLQEYVDKFHKLMLRGKYPEALEQLQRLAVHHPGQVTTWVLSASFHRLTGNLAAAEKAVRKALAVNYAPEALYELFALRRDAGDAVGARKTAIFMKHVFRNEKNERCELPERLRRELDALLDATK